MTMKKFCLSAGLVALLCSLAADECSSSGLFAGQGRTGPKTVLVDVIAAKDGLSVIDLTRDDFEVTADGKKAAVESAERVVPGVRDGQGRLYPKRLAVVFHDLNYSTSGTKPKDEEDIVRELAALAEGGTEVMVLQLDRFRGLSVLQPFTREAALVQAAAATAMDKSGVDAFADYSFADLKRWVFLKTVGGLLSASSVLKGLPGRKSLLLISRGIPDLSSFNLSEVQPGNLAGLSQDLREHEDRLEMNDPFNVFRGEKMRSGDEVLRRTVEFINALNITVYALDPGVFSAASPLSSTEYLFNTEKREVEARARSQSEDEGKRVQNLRLLAEETGGFYFRGANKYSDFRRDLGADLSGYYILKVVPPKPSGAEAAFHKVSVKVGRGGLDVRARKGYRAFSAEDEKNLLLSGAFYGPELFKDLPFQADFFPLVGPTGLLEPWVGIALPLRQIFGPETPGKGTRTLTLHVSLEELGGEAPGFRAKYSIPINVTQDFIASLPTRKYLWLYYKGPDVPPVGKKYRAIYVLYDEATGKAGGWTSLFTRQDISAGQKAALLTCVLGSPGRERARGEAAFFLNPKTGVLEYGPLEFFPRLTGLFSAAQDAFLFLQVFTPHGREALSPEYQLESPRAGSRTVPVETIAESWNEKTKVWSGVVKLSLYDVPPGEAVIRVAIPGPAGDERFVRRLLLTKLSI